MGMVSELLVSEHKNIILQMAGAWCEPCKQAKRYIKSIKAEDKVALAEKLYFKKIAKQLGFSAEDIEEAMN